MAAGTLALVAAAGAFERSIDPTDAFFPLVQHRFCDPVRVSNDLTVALHRYSEPGKRPSWILETNYLGGDWLFGERLRVLIDGTIYECPEDGTPIREVLEQGGCYERARFRAEPSMVLELASADSALIRLVGMHYYTGGSIKPFDLGNLRWFIDWAKTGAGPADLSSGYTEQRPDDSEDEQGGAP